MWDSWLDGLPWATLPLKVMSGTLHVISLGEWTSDVATQIPQGSKEIAASPLKATLRTPILWQHVSWPCSFGQN